MSDTTTKKYGYFKLRDQGATFYDLTQQVSIAGKVPGKLKLAYDQVHLAYVAALMIGVSYKLREEGKISHIVRWGGNWDKDGELLYDQNFEDMPHIELI